MPAPTTLVTALLEQAIRRYLALDPDSGARLAALRGGVVALRVTGVDLCLYFVPAQDYLQVLGQYDGEPGVTISGAPATLASLMAGAPGARLPEGVGVIGDPQLARRFSDLLRQVDLDWEALLAGLAGDRLAQRASATWRDLTTWLQHSRESLRQEVKACLQEQTRSLPTRGEVEVFMDEVDRLRSDADRLQARIQRLEHARERAQQ
ncbi:ubiquinone biosynthesis protein UbiJ [Ectothiorhodospira magna]|uniref:Ubiquinone biosynthesis accessory factor UbiJ n=1 Tax=Ectothiorhodospira magna TaxID=867345 RepID=A0A1H9DAH7_9GAMM|nr:SCP2 sterol-binding domain-containing protein [Ectothiorhodospira magna]SEQ09833.1 ubiquinone biosynthesis protein UbiJ [Ectothiorhodospira magna]